MAPAPAPAPGALVVEVEVEKGEAGMVGRAASSGLTTEEEVRTTRAPCSGVDKSFEARMQSGRTRGSQNTKTPRVRQTQTEDVWRFLVEMEEEGNRLAAVLPPLYFN